MNLFYLIINCIITCFLFIVNFYFLWILLSEQKEDRHSKDNKRISKYFNSGYFLFQKNSGKNQNKYCRCGIYYNSVFIIDFRVGENIQKNYKCEKNVRNSHIGIEIFPYAAFIGFIRAYFKHNLRNCRYQSANRQEKIEYIIHFVSVIHLLLSELYRLYFRS